MNDSHERFIFSAGTQVVAQKDVLSYEDRIAHPAGAVGIIVRSPLDRTHAYRVKFADGFEAAIHHKQLKCLADFKAGPVQAGEQLMQDSLQGNIIFRCVIGSRAYGLDDADSATDRRGVYLSPADLQWSLYGVPE